MLQRKATYFTPNLVLRDGLLYASGRMWMEDAAKYFEKITELTAKSTAANFKVVLDIDHINSSSVKQVLMYILLLKELREKGTFRSIDIEWNMHEDEYELIEIVKDLEHISEVPIRIGKIKNGKEPL